MPPKEKNIVITFGDGYDAIRLPASQLVNVVSKLKAVPESHWVEPNIRFISREYVPGPSGSMLPAYIVVTETRPGVKTLAVQRNFEHVDADKEGVHGVDHFSVSMPYLINVFVFRVLETGEIELDLPWVLSFYRTLPLSGLSDELLVCNLPNVMVDSWNPDQPNACVGWTCLHNAPEDVRFTAPVTDTVRKATESEMGAVIRQTQKVLEYYLGAIFTGNPATNTAWEATKNNVQECSSMPRWQAESEVNPDFALTADWLPHPEEATLGDVVKAIKEAILAIPHRGFTAGEPGVLEGVKGVTKRRLWHAIGKGIKSSKMKYF